MGIKPGEDVMPQSVEQTLLESIRSIDVDGSNRNIAYLEYRHGRVYGLMELANRMEIRELHDEIIEAFRVKWDALALSGPDIPIFDHIRSEKLRFAP